MLLGVKRVGKSSSGNTILGYGHFDTGSTAECVKRVGNVMERQVTVIDTPGWIAESPLERTSEMTKRQIVFSMVHCPPGPQAFLLVMSVAEPFSEAERKSAQQHLEYLGENIWNHTIVLFTYGDLLGNATIEQHIESEGEHLKWLIEKCGNKYHVLNNDGFAYDDQVTELLEKIEELVSENGGFHSMMDRATLQEVEERMNEDIEKVEDRQMKVYKEKTTLTYVMGKYLNYSILCISLCVS